MEEGVVNSELVFAPSGMCTRSIDRWIVVFFKYVQSTQTAARLIIFKLEKEINLHILKIKLLESCFQKHFLEKKRKKKT